MARLGSGVEAGPHQERRGPVGPAWSSDVGFLGQGLPAQPASHVELGQDGSQCAVPPELWA